jgi:uncharacterized protein YnzC (UPF0291/DUF896 family)
MITKEMLGRINELARKKREEGLTGEEQKEQDQLREMYLADIRSQVINQLESAGCKPKAGHNDNCGCGCGGKH